MAKDKRIRPERPAPPQAARSPLRWLERGRGARGAVGGLALLAGILYFPYLGAVGLWDPWESHYAEVAREMIARGDFIHPWWESAWFFSKPALDLWLMAAGMLAAGTEGAERHLGIYTEWGVRLPFMAILVLGAILLFVAADRLLSRRAALFGTIGMLCAPLTVFYARQAVPDPVFVGLLSAAMACLAIVLFEREPGEAPEGAASTGRDGWLISFYCFVGLATLSKGLLGFALPGAVALLYCVVTGEWQRLRGLRLPTGALIVLAICGPWYATMFGFAGRDDEGKTFFERFIVHDHFKRLALGVYTTTPGGTFVYFIEQLGFDAFPFTFAFPGALARIAHVQARPRSRRERAELFLLLWLLVGFAVFAFSATKFHHYAYPVLPPLLFFCGLFLEDMLEGGLRARAGAVLAGGLLYGLVAHDLALTPKHLSDLFVFNYERPYPDRLVDPRRFFEAIFLAAPVVALSPWIFDRLGQAARAARAALRRTGRADVIAAVRARFSGALPGAEEAPQDRSVVVAALIGLSVVFALYLGWSYWRRLSPHWTQRDLFYRYVQDSQPGEPIGAYLMNWRGETLYSRNTVREVDRPSPPSVALADFLAGPGRRKWLLCEQARLPALRRSLPAMVELKVVESRHDKFVLLSAEPSSSPSPPAAGTVKTPVPSAPIGAPP